MINIAIDGPMGSGKSGLARAIAERMGIKVFDTGAIYRGLAFSFNKLGLNEVTEENVKTMLDKTNLMIVFIGNDQHILINGEDVTPFIRTEEISQLASKISKFKETKEKHWEISRTFAQQNDCVMEGRDICSYVMPEAEIKLFLTADEKVRAKRRLDQNNQEDDLEVVLSNLRERDNRDRNDPFTPLKRAEKGILIDNSELSFEETVDLCMLVINQKLASRGTDVSGKIKEDRSKV